MRSAFTHVGVFMLAASALPFAAGAAQVTTQSGEALFAQRCGMCHRANGMGTGILSRRPGIAGEGLLEKRTDLVADYIRVVARVGIGNMPRISRGEVSDPQLNAIADYLAKAKSP